MDQILKSIKMSLRSPAKIIDIKTIKESEIKEIDGRNVLIVNSTKIERVNIIGIVVDISVNEITNTTIIRIDDGTGSISVMVFEGINNKKKKINIGDFIIIIGRIREFNNEKYIAAEIINKTTRKWFIFRKKQLKNLNKNKNTEINEKEDKSINEKNKYYSIEKTDQKNYENKQIKKTKKDDFSYQEFNEINLKDEKEETYNKVTNKDEINKDQIIYDLIKELDKGNGAHIDDILKRSKIEEAEEILRKLLREGEIYEVKPNRYKAL